MKKIILVIALSVFYLFAYAQPVPQWVSKYYGESHTDDFGKDITMDATGNVYVTGKTSSYLTSGSYPLTDYCTIKYNSLGDTVWVRYYDTPGVGNTFEDVPAALEVDGAGNVYVTGNSTGTGGGTRTIKYNSNGDTVWTRLSTFSQGYNMTIDGAANIYLASGSYYQNNYYFSVLKYDSSGTLQWLRRYGNGGSFSSSYATSIATDGTNTYATGKSGDYFYTVKLQSNGDTVWTKKTDAGIGNSVAFDAAGNAYATGTAGAGTTGNDYCTIKYDLNGDTLWVRSYTGSGTYTDVANAIVVDAAGNSYVTGYSQASSTDYATIKYNPVGDTLWVKRYDKGWQDYGRCIGLDTSGNVYVSGCSENAISGSTMDYLTIKYNSAGDTVWTKRFNGVANRVDNVNAMIVDVSGNVYITGETTSNDYSSSSADHDFCTIKYDNTGVQQWQAIYDLIPAAGADYVTAMTTDNAGFTYVTGISSGRKKYDYATVKYDPYGDTVWVRRYDGGYPNADPDYPYDIVVDNSGNVYVTGNNGLNAMRTIKYDANGNTLWGQTFLTGSFSYGIALGDSGNVFITGYKNSSITNDDFYTVKYDSNGVQKWYRTYGTSNLSTYYYERASAIATDNAGDVYVTGSRVIWNADFGWTTIKYGSNGDTLWTKVNPSASTMQAAQSTAMVSDGSAYLYVTGNIKNPISQGLVYCTVKYNALTGDTIWLRRFPNTIIPNNADLPTAIAIDNSGNCYVTGKYNTFNGIDFCTIKYNSLGDTVWVRMYTSPGISPDEATDIKVDATGNVYVSGYSDNLSLITTIKYDANGNQVWLVTYPGKIGNIGGLQSFVSITNAGDVIVSATSGVLLTENDFCTIKYTQPVGIETWESNNENTIVVYPNPSHEQATFIFPGGFNANEIVLYDVQGRKTIFNSNLKTQSLINPNSFTISHLKPGIYFYRVTDVKGKMRSGKMVVE